MGAGSIWKVHFGEDVAFVKYHSNRFRVVSPVVRVQDKEHRLIHQLPAARFGEPTALGKTEIELFEDFLLGHSDIDALKEAMKRFDRAQWNKWKSENQQQTSAERYEAVPVASDERDG